MPESTSMPCASFRLFFIYLALTAYRVLVGFFFFLFPPCFSNFVNSYRETKKSDGDRIAIIKTALLRALLNITTSVS